MDEHDNRLFIYLVPLTGRLLEVSFTYCNLLRRLYRRANNVNRFGSFTNHVHYCLAFGEWIFLAKHKAIKIDHPTQPPSFLRENKG